MLVAMHGGTAAALRYRYGMMALRQASPNDGSAGALRLVDGPIDLIVRIWGDRGEAERCFAAAADALDGQLATLARQLSELRRPVEEAGDIEGPIARHMVDACARYRDEGVTPMAAVAGAVADHVLERMLEPQPWIDKILVNNGGDIAFFLHPGHTLRVGLVADVDCPAIDGLIELDSESAVRGIATSGWRGRSFSLGIADSVTVLARNAAAADVAATLVANAVDIDHPAICRRPARSLDPDSDLGERLVTVGVGELEEEAIVRALDSGVEKAERYVGAGLIDAAGLILDDQSRLVGASATPLPTNPPRSRRQGQGGQAARGFEPPSSA